MELLYLQPGCSLSDIIPFIVSTHIWSLIFLINVQFKLYLLVFNANIFNPNSAALHKEEAYMHLLNDEDKENLKWLRIFK